VLTGWVGQVDQDVLDADPFTETAAVGRDVYITECLALIAERRSD